ncbi:hypothetical protein [Vibrio parahaemolyticus]|uniref:hypothetical protein n=1 Tax=Vibrio parahaemolyticus TaxID=670 RepID=UPI00112303E5|nr:hypothetical protein [Vibrio parahaemolyticus]MCX8941455.1 hypothetical protein [Vibrio parahaemolyticus]TOJ23263.1 hypothetical protein CGI43_24020 [Vibrio parahaemolyticus]
MARKHPLIEQAISGIVDVSKQFWQVSFFVTIAFALLTLFLAKYSIEMLGSSSNSPTQEAIFSSLGIVFYALPILSGVITFIFGFNALRGYCQSKYN